MTQLRRLTTILGLALIALLTVVATAEAQSRNTRPRAIPPSYDAPDYDRSGRGYDRSGRSRADSRMVSLARELEGAAARAVDVADRRHRRDERALFDSFRRFEDAARQFSRAVDRNGNAGRGELDHLVARYYDLRGDFSHYHGPQDLRAAFHRINTPMEDLYRVYTGRDLYRDDPNRGNGRHGQNRGQGRYDDRYDDRYDRHDDRDERGARDTRTRVPRRN